MKKLDTKLIRSVKSSKGQFISITIMIILALTIYVTLGMVGDNLYSSIFDYYEITNFGDVFVEVSRIPKAAIDKLTSIEGVDMAQGRISGDVPLRVEDVSEKVNVRVVSLSDEESRINNLFTLDGEELGERERTTVVLQQFFDGRDMQLGEILTPYIGGKEYPIEVVGVVASPEYIYLMENEQTLLPAPDKFGVIYVSEEFAQMALGYQGSYNEIMIKIDDEHLNRIDSIIDEIEDELDRYGVRRITKREDQLSHSMMMQEVESLEAMSGAVTFIFLMVAAVIINIMLSRMVKKDRTSIGVMKAIGYTNMDIIMHYAKYSISMGLIGSLIGILLSIPLSKAYVELFILYMNVPMFGMKIYYAYFAYGILLTSVFCIISGFIGARNVLKITPAESMRPEAPKSGKRIWLEKVKSIWKRISFSWKMVIRNIFRTKRRAAFLVIGIALTYAITIVPVYMSSIFNLMFDLQYGQFQTMDYNIDFASPMNKNAILEVSQLIDFEHIEPKAEIPLELSRGWRKETTSVIALAGNTKLYNFKDQSGMGIQLSKDGIFLSQILANSLDVQVGDEIIIKSYFSDKDDKTIKVKGIIEQYLGSNAYMDIDQMYDVIDERDLVTGVLINSEDEVVTKLKDVKNIRQIQSLQDMKNSLLEFMDMIIASMSVMMLFGGVLGFAIVYNITTVSINERIMEFSSLRVLGFDKNQIYRLVTRENGLMTIFGILLGIPLGYGMCVGLSSAVSTEIYSIPTMISPGTYIISAIATIVFVTVAQLATIRKIHNINFMEALKNRVS
ncbi:ABC transporter permease [Tissierella sp. Yu-01]|uniref:ABC transporter permease n=1 Tax=Tissierella sp. Yu-01 TaxID=3035694 RepID=UPI00240D0FD0|nr:ABC transporter permease [Tissierella sp. Yu-01]WFA08565.1 FtsX-like permease family protein [Tissierella sp. Yu-01]